MKDLNVLDSVTHESVAARLKAGFTSLKQKLDTAFKAANGNVSIDEAKMQDGFEARFAWTDAAINRDTNNLVSAAQRAFAMWSSIPKSWTS